jgi:hypothetical protein
MKKSIIMIVIIFSFLWTALAYMEDKVFCTVSKNSITVTMEKKNNFKCSEYITVLSQSINNEYNNILSLQKLINQWYDVEYWKEVREQKRTQIKKMLNLKEQIENAVSEFDWNLFIKLKEYIVYSSSSDRTKYKKAIRLIESYQKNWWYLQYDMKNKLLYLKEAVTAIDNMPSTTWYENLMVYYNRYLYLKNQIAWK